MNKHENCVEKYFIWFNLLSKSSITSCLSDIENAMFIHEGPQIIIAEHHMTTVLDIEHINF